MVLRMNIQNSNITTVFSQHHIWQPITNKLCFLANMILWYLQNPVPN